MQFASGVLYQSGHEVVLEGVGDDDVDEIAGSDCLKA